MIDRKVAIVTGGSRGIGRAIAAELAHAGYYIILTYKTNDQAAEETLALIRATGSDGEALKFDVADSTETEQHMTAISTRGKEHRCSGQQCRYNRGRTFHDDAGA